MNRIEYIKSDLYRYTGSSSFLSFILLYIKKYSFRRQCFFRFANSQKMGLLQALYTITQGRIQLPYNTHVGYGLYIGHNGPVVINANSVLGDNINLSQFLTIGSNTDHAANIGDRVYVGPNVCIVEDVHIANDVTIGAGSVVTKDIPPDSTVAGNYAKVIKEKSHPEFLQHLWNVEH